MSQYENSHDDIPRFEPWVGVLAASLVPAALTLYLPGEYLIPLIVGTGVLFLASLLMLRRQSNQKRTRGEQAPPSELRPAARAFDRAPLEMEGAEP